MENISLHNLQNRIDEPQGTAHILHELKYMSLTRKRQDQDNFLINVKAVSTY